MSWPMPPRMYEALQGAEPYSYGSQLRFIQPTVNVAGKALTPWMPVESGTISISITAAARRTLSSARFVPIDVNTKDTVADILPLSANGPASPYGREVQVRSGCFYGDGTADLIPVGTFVVEKITQSSPGTLDLGQCLDRTSRFSRILTYTIQTTDGADYIAIATQLLSATGYITAPAAIYGVPWIQADRVTDPTTGATIVLPVSTFTTGDVPWDQATDAVAAAGCVLYMDPTGKVQIRYLPAYQTGPPQWTYEAGVNATFYGTARTLAQVDGQDTAINHAIVLGASIDGSSPIRADSFDLDPGSPTYWDPTAYGDYADALDASQYISTQGAAQAASDAMLAAERGALESVSFNAAPNPSHEGWDLIRVTSPQSGTLANYQIATVNLPLGPAEMTVTTRSRRLTVV